MIRFESVSLTLHGGGKVLDDVNFSIDKGDFTWVVGPSGSGKSAILRLLHRGARPDAGQVLVGEQDIHALGRRAVPALRRNITLIDQRPRLLPSRTVLDNVAMPLLLAGEPAAIAERKARAAVLEVGMGHRVRREAGELRPGEQRVVALARALVTAPTILLADEPTGGLDPEISSDVAALLERVHLRGVTVLWATSRPELWAGSPHRVLELSRGALVREVAARRLGPGPAPMGEASAVEAAG